LKRRTFFKLTAVGAAGAISAPREASAATATVRSEAVGVLVDTTKCVGCGACEIACGESNHLPEPAGGIQPVANVRRTPTTTQFTVVNAAGVSTTGEDRFIKRQCMHCVEPACASACLVRALEKTPAGPVVYHADRCLGCRYCMVACPFGVPQFEYEKAVPLVQKCTFCADRQARGLEPACTSVCPSGALTFGKREALIHEARTRIYQNPKVYSRHIFGEEEVGGTSWMYITDVSFDQLGLPENLGTAAAAGYAQDALAGVPVVMTVGPALLMGLYRFAQRRNEAAHSTAAGAEDHHV
jgi:Fe-S-cluster-containing dehydrogenase component